MVIAIINEKIISPLLNIDALIAVESFNPKKYVISAETSAIPIIAINTKFRDPIFRIGSHLREIGVKKTPLIM